jgi:hypothetical protein
MPKVMLRRNWPGNFRRSIRNEKGEVLRVIEFAPGQAVEVLDDEMPSVQADLGHALQLVTLDKKNRPRVIPVAAANEPADVLPEEGPGTLSEVLGQVPANEGEAPSSAEPPAAAAEGAADGKKSRGRSGGRRQPDVPAN